MKNKTLLRIWNRGRSVYETEGKHKNKEPGKLRTVLKSLRYASMKDRIILAISIFCGISTGFNAPLTMYYLLAPVLSTFIQFETVGNPYHVNMTAEIPRLQNYGYGYYMVGVLTLITTILQVMGSEVASRNIMAKVKTAYLSKMLSLEINWYDKSQEQFVSTVSHDLQKMQLLFDCEVTNAADMVSFFLFGCIAGLIVSWKIALVSLAIMLITLTVTYYLLKATKKKEKLKQNYVRKCTKIISEVVGNTRTVAAYGGEHKEMERFKNTLKTANKYGLKQTTLIATGKAFTSLQLCICYSVAYYFATRLFLVGLFDPGYLVIFLSIQINALFSCSVMLNAISGLNMAMDSAYRVMKFLDAETSYSNSIEQGIVPDTFNADFSFRNVQFFYPTNLYTKVLHDLTLDIEPGKVTAVVGTSGGGKSTIISLITRLYDVTGGQILIGGVDIQQLNLGWLRNQIAVVTQEPTLFDTSIEENIRYGKSTATLEEIIEAAKISFAHGFIKKLPSGYSSVVGERGTKLSIGQKQRIAIARAIVRKPKLLLLDEATSALDCHSERIVQEALDNAMRERTTLIIAHRMTTVMKADVIYALKEGRVIEKGSHSELMELKGYYYSLAKVQELEGKDKLLITNTQIVPKEDLTPNEEAIPNEDNLEVTQKLKKLGLSMANLKVMIVWFLAVFFCTTSSTFLPLVHYMFSLFCQSFTYNKDELNDLAVIEVGYLFGLGIIIFISVIISSVMSTIATQLWLEKLQRKVFNKVVSMDISWFDWSGNSPNECLEILTNSPQIIESVTGDKAAQVVIFFGSVLFSLAYSFLVSWNITVINLPIFAIFIILICLRAKSRDADARSAYLTTRSTKVATEYVQNVKTIQTLNCQKYVINQYKNILVDAKKEAMVSTAWNTAVVSFAKTLIRWWMGTLFVYGGSFIATGNVKGTSFIGVVIALSMASSLAGPALVLMSQYSAARQAKKQLNRIANTKTSLHVLSDQGAKPEIKGNIVFRDVVFSYPTRDKVNVLKKLNLKIEAGKMVALVGDSGCGKSTIISLLERFYLPNEGKILIDGNNINDINIRHLRSQMGLVPQEPVLFDMTIKENIVYGLDGEASMDMIIEAAKVANIHNFIMKLPQAYDTLVGERGSKLSGGQKQRIAIARAVLRNPKVLLLDEATSALDTENEKAVQEALENASIGRTSIVIAHRLSTIRKADKIVVLQSGVVEEEGKHEDLIERRGLYFNLLNR